MKKFITNIAIFTSIIISILAVSYWIWFNEPKPEVKISKRNIIIGDSNTRWSIDDKILKNYSNYSTGGELYLFAYRKLMLLSEHNKIDTLLLSFSPHNIINNEWWSDSRNPLKHRMSSFYNDFSTEEHLDFFKTIPNSYIGSTIKIGKSKLSRLFILPSKWESTNDKTNMSRFGSFLPTHHSVKQDPPVIYKYKKPIITELEIKYLNKTVKECEKKNIHLIFIQPPKNYLRADFKYYMPSKFYDIYYQNYSSIDFLDFKELNLPPNSYYDIMHVNDIGAKFFSHFLQENGIKNLLKSNYNLKNIKNDSR